MGKGEGPSDCGEAQTKNLSSRQKENRGGTASEMGKGQGWEKVRMP
jgi:hypothetical protein